MPRADYESLVEPSLLDRLIDTEPGVSGDRHTTRADSVREYKAALRRDLEWLLNTRRTQDPDPGRLPELTRSVLHFGLPDVTSISRDSGESLTRLTVFVEQALTLFEPRLTNVKVTLAPREDTPFADVRFLVDAVLRLEPSPERITFDTVLHKGNGDLEVGGVGDA
jgi:type VI secretion system protein ImpF